MKAIFLLIVIVSCGHIYGQQLPVYTDKQVNSTFIKSLTQGSLSGQFRYAFMKTDNKDHLRDAYAHAAGAYLKYATDTFKHFSAAVSGSVVHKIISSDLSAADSITNKPNRYELGLFDFNHPSKNNVARMEELYLEYEKQKIQIRLGRQLLNTPFINPQDGRMRPTFVSGIWTTVSFSATKMEAGWINAVLPRSIGQWWPVAQSIGQYRRGISSTGTAADYAGHLSSKGMMLAGIDHSFSPGIHVKIWNQFVENIFNTTLLQADLETAITENKKLNLSIQYINQQKIKKGGNKDPQQTYFPSAKPGHVISIMTAWQSGKLKSSLNYTHIFKQAPYLMPREWGREPFFTFMPRERNEGFGNVHAWVIKTAYRFPDLSLNLSLQAGYFQLPAIQAYALNKYGMPSYKQVNAEIQYNPAFAKKLGLQLLYVYKSKAGSAVLNPASIYNKVDMALYQFMINYTF